jgi:DNA-binding CsgD family transcriptional regulator
MQMRYQEKESADLMLAAIYQAAADIVPSSLPLERLAKLTRSDMAFAGRYHLERRRGAIVASYNLDAAAAEAYEARLSGQIPWLATASFFQAEGLVWRGSEIVSVADLMRSEFFRAALAPQGLLHTAHLVLRVRGPAIVHAVLARRAEAEEFEDETLDICRRFALHARQAFEISAAKEQSLLVEAGIATAINDMPIGIAVIEAPATIRYISETCAAMFDGLAPAPPSGNGSINGYAEPLRIPASAGTRSALPTALPRPLLAALGQRPIPTSCVLHPPHGQDGRPLLVDLRPYQVRSEYESEPRPGYVLICRSTETVVEVDELSLREAFSLTAAEARICAALAGGDNVETLARNLGISPLTARTHLKHIFEKTYTTRQPELMKLLMSMSRRKLARSESERNGRLLGRIERSLPTRGALTSRELPGSE